MMTASFFEKGLNNLLKRDPDKPLEKIYQKIIKINNVTNNSILIFFF